MSGKTETQLSFAHQYPKVISLEKKLSLILSIDKKYGLGGSLYNQLKQAIRKAQILKENQRTHPKKEQAKDMIKVLAKTLSGLYQLLDQLGEKYSEALVHLFPI